MGDSRVDARTGKQVLEIHGLSDNIDLQRACEAREEVERYISLIESRTFLRECIQRNLQSEFSLPVIACSTVSDLERQPGLWPELAILSLIEASNELSIRPLKVLSEIAPRVRVIVLASINDVDLARTVIRHGAKGYIPLTMGFEIAIEAVRFVLAGGTYVPLDCLLAGQLGGEAYQSSQPCGSLTAREHAVIRAIQQGKSNKIIAHELNMCESTVKVHVRSVMNKLKAKNRTEVAIKARVDALDALVRQTATTP
jgi:DNA-binding NarL/FixJ family response regulator